MTPRLGADTERITSPALRQAEEEIGDAIERYTDGLARVGKVVLHERKSDLDQYVRQLVTESPEATTALLELVRRASQGDLGATSQLAEFLEKAEEENTRAAADGDANPHR
ncbi:hypothetical protein AB0J86_31030 [Micromonospora sp. NPDC049559]|uniref:hypothetical protein n=1 Tax=Micromonospora sp. NPDC049559 TaxID=3155923 RepID=UPI00343A591D